MPWRHLLRTEENISSCSTSQREKVYNKCVRFSVYLYCSLPECCVCVCVICVNFNAFVNIHRTLRIAFVRCVLVYSVHVYCIDLQYVRVCVQV